MDVIITLIMVNLMYAPLLKLLRIIKLPGSLGVNLK
jgi:hypothetical protein